MVHTTRMGGHHFPHCSIGRIRVAATPQILFSRSIHRCSFLHEFAICAGLSIPHLIHAAPMGRNRVAVLLHLARRGVSIMALACAHCAHHVHSRIGECHSNTSDSPRSFFNCLAGVHTAPVNRIDCEVHNQDGVSYCGGLGVVDGNALHPGRIRSTTSLLFRNSRVCCVNNSHL